MRPVTLVMAATMALGGCAAGGLPPESQTSLTAMQKARISAIRSRDRIDSTQQARLIRQVRERR